jgi:hypothetical protein
MLKKMVRKFGKNFYSETYFIGRNFIWLEVRES